MSRTLSTARFAAVLAVAAIIFGAGLVSGAAGDPLILGSTTNNSGGSATLVSSNVNGNAFAIAQTGAGVNANGIRGDASTGTGGVFTSSSNNALFATAASGNRFAMVAVSNGGAGTGGALFADGNANPAIDIQTDGSVPPMTVSSTGLVTNLNSDLVDGLQANMLTRLASAADTDNALVGVNGTAISVSITAPTRGWLHISASSDNFASAVGSINCNLDVDGTNIAASFRTMAFDGGNNTEEDCSTNAVFFTCGGTHTVALEGSAMNAGDVFDETTIEAEFHPFDGAGNRPSLIPCIIIPLEPEPGFTESNE